MRTGRSPILFVGGISMHTSKPLGPADLMALVSPISFLHSQTRIDLRTTYDDRSAQFVIWLFAPKDQFPIDAPTKERQQRRSCC
jgi:hypothetical protein